MLDNTINNTRKELQNRYDLKGANAEVNMDKKADAVELVAENDMQITALVDILLSKANKQGLNVLCFDLDKEPVPSGKTVKKQVGVKQGIDRETARKLVQAIKDSKIKVQASIMDDQVRVTGKKLDDLQAVIAFVRKSEWDIPLQFDNMRN